MKQVILDFPKQFRVGAGAARDVGIKGDFSNVIICGIGGSALPGSLLFDLEIDLPMPFYIHRDYNLPKTAGKNSLILCISYSGNTEETVSAYQQAIDKGYQALAMATGGKLQEMAQENNLPLVLIPNTGIQPRSATGCLMAAVLQVLENSGIVQAEVEKLLAMADNLRPQELESQGKELAGKLVGKIPVVYASRQYRSLARVWKIKFNENSKIMAFWNYFPELNHNEMVGFTRCQMSDIRCQISKFYVLILRDEKDNIRILKRMALTADLIKEVGVDVEFVEIAGANKQEKIFKALLLGDWLSYYLALAYGQDPTPVKIVEDFKKRLIQL